MMNKIFITGSTGFVGQNLVRFYNQTHEIFEHTRHMNLVEKLNEFKPDVIINSAAELYRPEDMFVPNVLWNLNCLNYVKKNPSTRMVQIGSSAEYGPLPRASRETDRINPIDVYQATKGSATLMSQGYARQYDLNISIARPYSIFGPGERHHRLFPKLYKAFFKNEPMTLNQGYHDFIYIDDFIRGIDLLTKIGDKGDIVNFGSGKQYSNFEVADIFKKIAKRDASITFENKFSKKFESEIWICDTSYSKTKYNFEVEFSLEEGIKKFLTLANY